MATEIKEEDRRWVCPICYKEHCRCEIRTCSRCGMMTTTAVTQDDGTVKRYEKCAYCGRAK